MARNCPNCNKWTVRGANFCHHCACVLGGSVFEYGPGPELGPGQVVTEAGPRKTLKDKAMTATLLGMAAACGVLFAGWDAAWIAFTPMIYLSYEPAKDFVAALAGKLPEPKSEATTLRVEHVTEDKRHWLLYDFPEGISLDHLQHIARKVLPEPIGEGAKFSRRVVCEKGFMSQGQFETIKEFWIRINYAYYRGPDPREGIILTERCNRLLKKSLNLGLVAGGGWLAVTEKTS